MTLDDYLVAYKEGRLSEAELRERIRESREAAARAPLSEGQKGLWVEHGRSLSATGYNIPLGFRIGESVDVASLRRAFEFVLAQHTILSSVIEEADGVPYQRIDPSSPVAFSHEDWSGRTLDRAVSYLNEKAREPFCLHTGPLARMHVVSLSAEEHVALVVVHHIVFDGASWPVLLSTLLTAYEALRTGAALLPAPAGAAYRDFVRWEQQMLASHAADAHRAYWQRQLAPPLPLLEIPSDWPRTSKPVAAGRTYAHVLGPDVSRRIAEECRARGVSAATYFLAVYQLFLHRYTNECDVVVGMPTMGRPQARFEHTIGYFVNMIAVRSRIDVEQPFADFVRMVGVTVADGLDHAAYPFPNVVRDLNAPRRHAPIFQVGYSYQSASLFGRQGPRDRSDRALRIELLDGINQEGAFGEYELALEVRELGDTYDVSVKYDSELFARSIARMTSHYRQLLEGVLNAPSLPLRAHSMLSREESDEVLVRWNETTATYPAHRCIHELFEEQAGKTPSAVALTHEDDDVTYAELNRRANQLADYLRSRGVGPDSVTAICAERSVEMVVGVLGILKAGGAYVPLDPEYPRERLEYMLGDAAPRIVLTQERLRTRLPATSASVLALDTQWSEIAEYAQANIPPAEAGVAPRHLAYVIYTSGSTGRPKGTAMPHRALVNLIEWHRRDAQASPAQRTLQFAALGFDVSFQEIFATLCVGGTLVLIHDAIRGDPQALTRLMSAKRVQRLFLPFSALHSLAESLGTSDVILPCLEDVITAGEQLRITPAIAKLFKALPSCRLHNHYGPTESHVVTALTLSGDPEGWAELPAIGRPISNARIYILDGDRRPVPVGVTGEIHIGGVAVARGYLHRPELTAERFIEDPFSADPSSRLYRTGDLGRFRADRTIEFLGRNDDQVKIRGFRIELGEIESQLRRCGGVKDAVVAAREDSPGEKRLVAYVAPRDGKAPDSEDLRAHLKATLPEYMIPAAVVILDALPLSPNGKLDRRALPAPALDAYSVGRYEAPEGAIEVALAGIWEKLLHVPRLGRHDNFFDLGGHSLMAMQVIARLREDLAIDLSPNALFDHQTVAALAEYIGALERVKRELSFGRLKPAAAAMRQRGVV